MILRHLVLIVVTINCLATAALVPSRAFGAAQADLVDFKYMADTHGSSGITLRTVGTVINKSTKHLQGRICVRLYDADGFLLDDIESGDLSLALEQSEAATGNGYFDQHDWEQVVLLKAYFSRECFLLSPELGLSPVVQVKTQNAGK